MKIFTRLAIALVIMNCSSSTLFAKTSFISLSYGARVPGKTDSLTNKDSMSLSVLSLTPTSLDSFLSKTIVKIKSGGPLNGVKTLKATVGSDTSSLKASVANTQLISKYNLQNAIQISSLSAGDQIAILPFTGTNAATGKPFQTDTLFYNIVDSNKKQTNTNSSATGGTLSFADYEKYIRKHYPNLKKTDVGYRDEADDKLPGETSNSERYYTIHIFFDESGNSLLGSIPTGIQRKYHYMVHVLSGPDKRCSVTVKSGDLVDSAVFYNMGASIEMEALVPGEEPTKPIAEYAFNTFPTTSDLVFELNIRDSASSQNITKTYTIKKSPFYIGAFNAGVVYSWLKNPSYQLVNSPVNAGMQTVKTENSSGTGVMVTAMYTVYWSPVNALCALFNPKDHRFSSWGRSYLDDGGSFLRKIYPCIGLGLKDQVFTNFIAGLNCEPMQGFGIFAGANIRQVNTFDMPNFTAGVTDVTQDQFNYYQNQKWKAGFTLGIELDISIFNKLVGSISTPAK